MDSFSMFDTTDLSLFGGELEVLNVFASKQHGSQVAYVEDIKPLDLELQPDEESVPSQLLSPSLPTHGITECFPELNWLDSKVDLFDLLDLPVVPEKGPAEDDTVAATPNVMLEETDRIVLDSSNQSQGATGLHLLQSMADEMVSLMTPDPVELSVKPPEGAEMDIMELLSSGGADNLDVDVVSSVDFMPALSPVTSEDIENVLSSGCSSPATSEHGDTSFGEDSITPVYSSGEALASLLSSPFESCTNVYNQVKIEQKAARPSRSKASITPYDKKSREQDRKLRKKQQNKDAATRYRQKKRAENDAVGGELDSLESRNKELRENVDQMTREIQYLKDLLAEVYKAKGQLK